MQVLCVLLRFKSGFNPGFETFDNLFTEDERTRGWLRWNAFTWLIRTERTANEWYEILRQRISRDDSLLIVRADLSERFGWAPEWVWDWIDDKPVHKPSHDAPGRLPYDGTR